MTVPGTEGDGQSPAAFAEAAHGLVKRLRFLNLRLKSQSTRKDVPTCETVA